MVRTPKEKLIMNHYKKILEDRLFDEFDLIGFFIFIRSILDKGHYPCIYDVCDTIAHRGRDQGKANSGITSIIQNQYRIRGNGKKLIGANGITEKAWKKEWIRFGQEYVVGINEAIIKDISLCVLSLLQNVCIIDDDSTQFADLRIVKGKDLLCVSITEGSDGSQFVVFFVVRVATETIKDGPIDEAVYTVREDGQLRLLTESQTYIV